MLNDQDNQDNTPLHYAVENRSYDVAKICIEKGTFSPYWFIVTF